MSDIQVFQPRFDEFRQTSWEVLEDPTTDESDRDNLQKQVTSLEERWGALIRSVYSRSETYVCISDANWRFQLLTKF